ncbi:MAG: type II secretion system protein [Burkholderiales bacterium]|jgi:general secretion pathway protein G|nr:type II secretion system protein [Burkholderiales bacterium]
MSVNRTSSQGFTLIEMLIVMALVALLLTIALPRYFGALEKSKNIALQENLRVLRVSIDRYYSDKGRYPLTLDQLVEQRYLKAVPIDPITESPRTWILVPARNAEVAGVSDVKSGAPGVNKEGRAYDSM